MNGLYLVTVQSLDVPDDSRYAFLVRAKSPYQAKRTIAHYCKEKGWNVSTFMHCNDFSGLIFSEDGLVQIDQMFR